MGCGPRRAPRQGRAPANAHLDTAQGGWAGGKDGLLWLHMACESARIPTTIVSPELTSCKHNQWHACRGGGAAGNDQSYLLQGAAVLAKD